MKGRYLKSVIVLTVICFVITLALAITNYVTAPIIQEYQEKQQKEALYLVLPEASDFAKLESDNIPKSVLGIYEDKGGTGYAIVLLANGYDSSKPMNIVVGISTEGKITACHVISCNGETSGIGTKISDIRFLDTFKDKDASLDDVDTISGATISSKAFIAAVKDAFVAYESVRGGRGK